ncbi:MAG TPA: hypothetical protein VLF18_08165 [Tahibacter sp.]|uniref:hypothetical protein n=1 Tax=Tahibacter sp. TaxID=2056211 RepID=UPI002C80B027|nr:hypothetical protein [Tahibacter sp.]HSX60157.1 hypothetical protein [Tahibacter sp.]
MRGRGAVVVRVALAVAAVFAAGSAGAQSAAAGTALRVTMDADAVEIVRAWRRSQGLDPPDRDADRRVAALLQRLSAERDVADASAAASDTNQPPGARSP